MDDETRRHFTILYFLADNTIEIREQFAMNCGRDNSPVFFARGIVNDSGIPVTDHAFTKVTPNKNFPIRNIQVGKFVNLVYIKLFVYDADTFTRKYFETCLGSCLAEKIDVSVPENTTSSVCRIATPPYTGYGSWDDSMGSVFSLNPKPPRKDLFKLFVNEGKVLKFFGKFFNPKIEDEIRRFVFSYYLADEHLMIHEPPIRNSGLVGGRFLEKGVYMNGITGDLVKPEDLQIGKVIELVKTKFFIEGCDSYTKMYLEAIGRGERGDIVPQVESILPIASQVKEKLFQMMPLIHETFRKVDRDGKSIITIDKFREILLRFGFILSEQDTLLVMQVFDKNENGQISYQEFCDGILGTDASDDGTRRLGIDEYRLATDRSIEERSEFEKSKRAMKELSALFYSRDNFVNRLIMEVGKISRGDKYVASSSIGIALTRMGHIFDQKDIDRCVYKCLGSTSVDLNRVDYVHFIQFMHKSFHKLI
jgi:hypothetical protein